MKVEIIQSESVSELDRLINDCIQRREIVDIKLSSTMLDEEKILYTSLIMIDS
ncbi:hypothetical protein [Nitrosopumilus sp. S6]